MHTTTGWGWLPTNEGAWCLTTLPTGWFLHLECKLSNAAQCKSTRWKHVPFSRNSQKVVLEGWDCWASCQGLNPSLSWCHLTICCFQLCSTYVSCRVLFWVKWAFYEFRRYFGNVSHIFATELCFLTQNAFHMYLGCGWTTLFTNREYEPDDFQLPLQIFLPDKYKCTTLGVGIPSQLEFQLPLKVPKTNFEELLKCHTSL